jgi:serine/threonine protein kinase
VHCDIKPDNFLLNEDGEIKLIDFTIARKAAKGMISRMFGGTKVIRGTRSYMSPEQIRGQPVDGRSDIYALGCVFYELLAGKPPYFGDSPNDLLQKHLTAGIPSPVVHNEQITSEMNDLIRRMLAKKPEDRPPHMIDVLKDLKSLKPLKVLPKLAEREESQESSD